MPGFYTTYDSNYVYSGVRGFGIPGDYNTRLLILMDGHRLNDNVYDSSYVERGLVIDVEMIERVEFVRGPSSSLYGSSAFSVWSTSSPSADAISRAPKSQRQRAVSTATRAA